MKVTHCVAAFLMTSSIAFSQDGDVLLAEDFTEIDFSAPVISSISNFPNVEGGTIVYSDSEALFYGYSPSNGWLPFGSSAETVDGNAGSSGTVTLSAGTDIHNFNPTSANMQVNLDNTFTEGRALTLINAGTKKVTVKAIDAGSNETLVRTIYAATSARFVCMSATCDDDSDWIVLDTAVSDWQSFTPSWSNVTWSSTEAYYRRTGPNMEIYFRGVYSGNTGGAFKMSIPDSLSIRSFVTSNGDGGSATGGNIGSGKAYVSAANYTLTVFPTTSTEIALKGDGFAGSVQASAPAAWGSGDVLTFNATIPISTWEVTKK